MIFINNRGEGAAVEIVVKRTEANFSLLENKLTFY